MTMSFVDSGYQGDEAQRVAYEASRISLTVVKRTDTTVKGFIVLPSVASKSFDRRRARLIQPSVLSTTHLLGNTMKPLTVVSVRLTTVMVITAATSPTWAGPATISEIAQESSPALRTV